MSAQDNANKLYWLAYCDVIRSEIGKLGDSNAIFFSTKSQRVKDPFHLTVLNNVFHSYPLLTQSKGPPAECAQEYQNFGILEMANNLLAADNLFYAPSATNTYIDSLKTYMSFVDVGGDPSDGQKYAVMKAKEAEEMWQKQVVVELKNAYAQYNTMKEMGMIPDGQKLLQWTVSNAPAYQNALASLQNASGAYKSAQLSMQGPLSGSWAGQMDKITQAIGTMDHQVNGLNMPVSPSSPPSVGDLYQASISKTPIPPPTDIYWAPLYSCQDYSTVVKKWDALATQPAKGANPHKLDLRTGSDVKETAFGQTSLSGDLGFSYGGIISFEASASSDEKEETLSTHMTDNNVSITMTWDSLEKVTVSPGAWNISNPRGNYPNLKPDAPKTAKILVRTSQLVLVNKLGFTVTFSGDIKDEFDRQYSKTVSAGGSVRLFGIPINVGAHGSDTKKTGTHKSAWDASSGTFTVAPDSQIATANVIAVVGEKVQTF